MVINIEINYFYIIIYCGTESLVLIKQKNNRFQTYYKFH